MKLGAKVRKVVRPMLFNLQRQHKQAWIDRALTCSAIIESLSALSDPLKIADIGCGDMKLKKVLKGAGVNCVYTGFDLLPQFAGVIAFDVTVDPLPTTFDIAAILGVTEYLTCLEQALGRLRPFVRYLVVSHVIADEKTYSLAECKHLGWKNHLSSAAFEEVLVSARYEVIRSELTPDRRTRVWLCKSKSLPKSEN
jgi:hypothetical protein